MNDVVGALRVGRPYGIRQLVRAGKRPVLCRDLTEPFHRAPRGHLWGTEETIAQTEQIVEGANSPG
jgi:hypothetical protein